MNSPAREPGVHELMIDVSRQDGRRLLTLTGELDLASASNLVEAVSQACDEGTSELILDIGGLEFVDSTGLRAILNARTLCAEHECSLSIAPSADRIGPQVRRLFEVTGLLARLPFADLPPSTG